VYADLISTVRTSMKFQLKAWRRSREGGEQIKLTEAIFTFVAIDSGSRPLPPSRRSHACWSPIVRHGSYFYIPTVQGKSAPKRRSGPHSFVRGLPEVLLTNCLRMPPPCYIFPPDRIATKRREK
jgi:acyl-CoA hydrolase